MNTSHATLVVAALLVSVASWAQDCRPTEKGDETGRELECIEIRADAATAYSVSNAVTGTKTDTPLMQTPLSIQVIPQQILQDQKDTLLVQALVNVSGVRSHNYGGVQENIYLRGFLSTTTFRNGFRIDDDFGMGMRSMTNVESVEVLKGPAAILYGRVEPGGIVNLVTKKPQATPYYSIEQEAGSWDHYLTSLDATGPVNEDRTLLYRVIASYDTTHSWRDSVESENLFIAPSLRWEVSPRTQVNLEAEYSRNPLVWDSGQAVPYDAANDQFIWLPRKQNLTAGNPATGETTYLGFNVSHQFDDNWSIKYQFNRREYDQHPDPYYWLGGFEQVDGTWMVDRQLQKTDGTWTTTASIVDLTGHFDTAGLQHTVLVGADTYRREVSMWTENASESSTTTAFDPARAHGVIDPAAAYGANGDLKNLGVYLQDQVRLPHDLFLLAGLRYQDVKRTGNFVDASGAKTPDPRQSDSATTNRVGLLWQPSDQLSLYGNYAENFGANTGRDWQGNSMDPETAEQKEIGAKAQFFGGKLMASLALFELTKQNVAVCDVVHDPSCTFGFQTAVGEIRSRGPEFDVQGEIQPGWNVIFAYTYTDIVVTKSTPGSSYSEGNRMPNVPHNMVSVWSTYELTGVLRGWKIGGGVTAYDSATDVTNTFDTPGYGVVNAMTSYEFKAGRSRGTLQLNVNNLFDKEYYTDLQVYDGTIGQIGALFYGPPRFVTASVKFEM